MRFGTEVVDGAGTGRLTTLTPRDQSRSSIVAAAVGEGSTAIQLVHEYLAEAEHRD